MDVHCSTCNEPWDTYHLWQDAISEVGLSGDEIASWRRLPSADRLCPATETPSKRPVGSWPDGYKRGQVSGMSRRRSAKS